MSLPPQRPAVDLDGARLDPTLQPGPRILRQQPRQRLVEPQAGQVRRQIQRMVTELGRWLAGRKSWCRIRYTGWIITAQSQRKALICYPCPEVSARRRARAVRGAARDRRLSSNRKDPTKSSPEVLYKKAHKSLDSYDFNAAIKQYEALTARFPFTDQARQARLDLIYAYYRAGEGESATDAAETFIRENPTHPRVDYAWYVKGLVDFERSPNAIEHLFRVDLTQRPPSTARKAFARSERSSSSIRRASTPTTHCNG